MAPAQTPPCVEDIVESFQIYGPAADRLFELDEEVRSLRAALTPFASRLAPTAEQLDTARRLLGSTVAIAA